MADDSQIHSRSDFQFERGIACQFVADGGVAVVQPLNGGLVNDTFLVTSDSARIPRFVLQRINTRVFPDPSKIMGNLEVLNQYVNTADRDELAASLPFPKLFSTGNGKACYTDERGGCWRALAYIENSVTRQRLESPGQAEEVGYALGRFHNLLRGLDPATLEDTLPGFHITPAYLSYYDNLKVPVGDRAQAANHREIKFCRNFIDLHRHRADVLEQAKHQGLLKLQVIHGDPKLNNILFDATSGKGLAMVDLDTVKPGLVHYDLGDCLRSCCNHAGESPESLQSVRFELGICELILKRYFLECGTQLTLRDFDYLYDSIRLLPFELGLRFFTDYLEGNRYFKVADPEQNLLKALVQFRLVENIEHQESELRRMIRTMAPN